MTRFNHSLMGTLGDFCPNFVVNIKPSKLMKRKCEKVTRFPQPASGVKKNKKMMVSSTVVQFFQQVFLNLTFIDQEL